MPTCNSCCWNEPELVCEIFWLELFRVDPFIQHFAFKQQQQIQLVWSNLLTLLSFIPLKVLSFEIKSHSLKPHQSWMHFDQSRKTKNNIRKTKTILIQFNDIRINKRPLSKIRLTLENGIENWSVSRLNRKRSTKKLDLGEAEKTWETKLTLKFEPRYC